MTIKHAWNAGQNSRHSHSNIKKKNGEDQGLAKDNGGQRI